MERIFHTPEGVRDIYKDECYQKLALQKKIHEVFGCYGYEDIETPTFEYFEVFSKEVGTIPSKDLYKFFDQEGHTLVLRPDFTPSIARAAASCFLPGQDTVRLCYTGNTFINNSSFQGRLKEATQMGVERIGDASADADAELLAMMAESLLASGLTEFQISVGQVQFFKSLLEEAGMEEAACEELRSLISSKNNFGVEELILGLNLPTELEQAFLQLPELFGSKEVLDRARSLTGNEKALAAISRLEEIYEVLRCYGYDKYISFDLGMLSKYDYYTGIICQAFTYGTGEPIVKGGRYDRLLEHFGKPACATGFAISMDQLMLALSRQKIAMPQKEETVELCYTKAEREEAIRKAVALRREGRAVVLTCLDQETRRNRP
ncbi:MAG: ATP phosphoribosyltransferase regulatory subunit [Blautia sp.]|jgi:ATP phosphoribosyltransferase regulatory subunit